MKKILLSLLCMLPLSHTLACGVPEPVYYAADPLITQLAIRDKTSGKVIRYDSMKQYLASRFGSRQPATQDKVRLKMAKIPDNTYLVPVQVTLPQGTHAIRTIELVYSVHSRFDDKLSPYVIASFKLSGHSAKTLGTRFKVYSTGIGWLHVIAIDKHNRAWVAASKQMRPYVSCANPVYVATEERARMLNRKACDEAMKYQTPEQALRSSLACQLIYRGKLSRN